MEPALLRAVVVSPRVITGVAYFLNNNFVFIFLSPRQALYSTKHYPYPFEISPNAFPLGDDFLLTIAYQICHSASSSSV